MPDYRVSGEDEGGVWVELRSDWGRKQPKNCVGVSVVGKRAFLQRSQPVEPPSPQPSPAEREREASCKLKQGRLKTLGFEF